MCAIIQSKYCTWRRSQLTTTMTTRGKWILCNIGISYIKSNINYVCSIENYSFYMPFLILPPRNRNGFFLLYYYFATTLTISKYFTQFMLKWRKKVFKRITYRGNLLLSFYCFCVHKVSMQCECMLSNIVVVVPFVECNVVNLL